MVRLSVREVNVTLGCVELTLLALTLAAMAFGPGFHLRQGWRAYNRTTGHLIECKKDILHLRNYESSKAGATIDESQSNADRATTPNETIDKNTPGLESSGTHISNSSQPLITNTISTEARITPLSPEPPHNYPSVCKVQDFSEVDSFVGHTGSLVMDSGLWHQFHFSPLFLLFILTVISLQCTCMIMCTRTKYCNRSMLILSAMSMQAVALYASRISNCHSYQMETYQKLLEEMEEATIDLDDTTNSIVIDCYVFGFLLAALSAQMVSIMMTLHSVVIHRIEDFEPPSPEPESFTGVAEVTHITLPPPTPTQIMQLVSPSTTEDSQTATVTSWTPSKEGIISPNLTIASSVNVAKSEENPLPTTSADSTLPTTSDSGNLRSPLEVETNQITSPLSQNLPSSILSSRKKTPVSNNKKKSRVQFNPSNSNESTLIADPAAVQRSLFTIPNEVEESRKSDWEQEEAHFSYEEPASESPIKIKLISPSSGRTLNSNSNEAKTSSNNESNLTQALLSPSSESPKLTLSDNNDTIVVVTTTNVHKLPYWF